MGRQLDWSALETVTVVLGIEDVELLIAQLVVLRDQQQDRQQRQFDEL